MLPERFHGALVEVVGLGEQRGAGVLFDHQVLDTQVGQEDRCGQAAAASSDDEDGNLVFRIAEAFLCGWVDAAGESVAHLPDAFDDGGELVARLIRRLGLRVQPIPFGVPVKMTSPENSGRTREREEMSWQMVKTNSPVRAFCICSPFRVQPIARSSGSANSSGVTRHGPSGAKPG